MLQYEISITPGLFSNVKGNPDSIGYPLLILLRDLKERGFIAHLDSGWLDEVTGAVRPLKDGVGGKIKTVFGGLEKQNRLILKRHNGMSKPSSEKEWVCHYLEALSDSQTRPASHTIVSSLHLEDEFRSNENVYPLQGFLVSDRWSKSRVHSVTLEKTMHDYQPILESLLGPAKRAKIIDPYFSCGNSKWDDFVEICLIELSEARRNAQSELHIHSSIEKQADEFNCPSEDHARITRRWHDHSESKLVNIQEAYDKELTIHVWLWSRNSNGDYDKMHDRYLVTDHVAVSAPWGLDCFDSKDSPPITRWSLLSTGTREELNKEFPLKKVNYENRKHRRGKGGEPAKLAFYELKLDFEISA